MSEANAKEGSRRIPLAVLGSDEAERQRLAGRIRALGVGETRFGRHDRMLYATDAKIGRAHV